MQLLTSDLKDRLLRNGRASAYAAASGRDFDPLPVVKLFTPDAQATWLLTELDPACEWRAFGLWGPRHKPNYVDRSVMRTRDGRCPQFQRYGRA
jgi:hypothetical protein